MGTDGWLHDLPSATALPTRSCPRKPNVVRGLAEATARAWTYQTHPAGALGLIADRHRRVLVGAWAVAPQAGEWIHQAALAIRAAIPVDVLLDGIAQFPTFSEAYLLAAEHLDL